MTNSRIIEIFFTNAQISITTTEQNYKRTHFTQAVKLSYFLVILKEIIVALVTKNSLIDTIFVTKDRKEMVKTNPIFGGNFLNAVHTA